MPHRRSLLLLLALVVAGTIDAVIVFWATATPFLFSPHMCRAIQAGMTQREVEAILGVPAGNYGVHNKYLFSERLVGLKVWGDDCGAIWVGFDANGRVLGANYSYAGRPNEPLFDRLCRWVGL